MSLPPDLVEMLSEFASGGVRHLAIGGHAVSLHARPLDTAADDIERVCAALEPLEYPPTQGYVRSSTPRW
jgi:hypothetical protein